MPSIMESSAPVFGTLLAYGDAAEPWQVGFQEAATPVMQGIIDLHHDIWVFPLLLLVVVSWMLVRAFWHFHYLRHPYPTIQVHGTIIEIIRTIAPSLLLMFIAIPSFALLYSMDEVVVTPAITIKAIGHQRYRSAPQSCMILLKPYQYSKVDANESCSNLVNGNMLNSSARLPLSYDGCHSPIRITGVATEQ